MAITFTNKAAAEMRERVNRLIDEYSESVWVSTFHSSCVRILRRYIDRLGYDNNFTIYDTEDQKKVIKDVCKRLNIDTKTLKEKTLLSCISNAKNELQSPDNYIPKHGNYYLSDKIQSVYSAYQRELKKNNALDFDDLIMKTVELFEKDEEVLKYYQENLN
jgi:DNA helicase-2/ATP-dependent DNA helicase PcrA